MDSIIEKNLFEPKRPRGRPKKEKLSKEQLIAIKLAKRRKVLELKEQRLEEERQERLKNRKQTAWKEFLLRCRRPARCKRGRVQKNTIEDLDLKILQDRKRKYQRDHYKVLRQEKEITRDFLKHRRVLNECFTEMYQETHRKLFSKILLEIIARK